MGAQIAAGTVGSVTMGAIAPKEEVRPPPQVPTADGKKDPKEKYTYSVTEKNVDAELAAVNGQVVEQPLKSHLEYISFYVLASLSVVLPLLFVGEYTQLAFFGSS